MKKRLLFRPLRAIISQIFSKENNHNQNLQSFCYEFRVIYLSLGKKGLWLGLLKSNLKFWQYLYVDVIVPHVNYREMIMLDFRGIMCDIKGVETELGIVISMGSLSLYLFKTPILCPMYICEYCMLLVNIYLQIICHLWNFIYTSHWWPVEQTIPRST